VTGLEQIISCPNCAATGWSCYSGEWKECCVCKARGRLVIDVPKTLALPIRAKEKKVR
jgi:hypothetical protein